MRQIRLTDELGEKIETRVWNDALVKALSDFELAMVDPAFCIGFRIYTEAGELLYRTYQTDGPFEQGPQLVVGINRLEVELPPHHLSARRYRVVLVSRLHDVKWLFIPSQQVPESIFRIERGLSRSPYWIDVRPGLLALVLAWQSARRDECHS